MAHETFLDFWKASHKHLRDARELIQPPTFDPMVAGNATRHLRGGWYLGGYAIECVFKTYLITTVLDVSRSGATLTSACTTLRKRGKDVPDLLSAGGHRLSLLYGLTDLDDRLPTDQVFRRRLGISQRWTHLMRYDPTLPKREDALSYVEAVGEVHGQVIRLHGS